MENLPCEMIEHIYSFLPYSDHLRATEVCFRWKEIFEKRVLKDTLLTIAKKHCVINKHSFHNGLQRLAKSTRMYQDLMFEDIDFAYLDRQTVIQLSILLANMGLYVLNLTLKDCRLTDGKLFLIVHLMKEMQTICIDSCEIYNHSIFVPELEPRSNSIQLVSICNVKAENEASIVDLLTSGNSAEIHVTVDKAYIDPRTDVIERYAGNIKVLSCLFSETRTIRTIFGCPALNLESLKLHRNPSNELHYVTLLETISTQRNLRKLSINMPISLRVLAQIAQTMFLLEFLEVTINDDVELRTTKWPKLKVLSLSHSSNMNSILNGMDFENLEELRLHTKKLTRNTMETIYEKCAGLKKLTLTALSMVRCESILASIGDRLADLVEIDLQCSSRTTFIPFFKSIVTLKQLDSLSICCCDFITNKTLIQIHLPYLSTLKITRNFKISKEGLQDLFSNCPRIVSLTIRKCPAIDDEAVKIVTTCLPQLKVLDISESPIITLNSIRYIMENCNFLKDLQIENCRRLLIQWRNAPYYISSIHSLRSYYNMYPEFFHFHLLSEPAQECDSDYCFYNDSEADISDDFIENYYPEPANSAEQSSEEADDIIILSDEE
ncbi:uncharacterized protein LOC135702204 [Ochlerotatus camptorhynchus]|uniref:uncharacterized protein LOC135702204 n=1 Tax=Ochlerotatus camptorhynchus TaxID=644619 RepID=UPI0031E355CF